MTTIQRQFPTGFMVFCQVGMAVQALWELCLLPLMLNRWTRVFVVCQGLAFFSVSLVLMNLQYLPLVEMLMWLLIFGPAAAGWVASRRPAPATWTAWRPSPPKPSFSGFMLAMLLISGFATATQVLLAGPLVPQPLFAKVRYVHEHMKPLFSAFGQARVEVFNKQDLEMASAHLVIQEVDAAGRHLRVVPLNDLEGGRLDYLRNNLAYFNHSLHWRRLPLDRKFDASDPAHPSTLTKAYARAVATLDASLTGLDGPRRYRANVYVRAMRLDLTPPRWTSARLTSRFPIELTTAELEAHRKTHLPRFNLPPGQAFSAERERLTHDALASMSAVRHVLDTP